jgi:energy-converting hydrogenase Eha subunit A
VRTDTVESDSLSAANPRDYRRGKLLGWMMVVVGALFALILIVTEMSDGSSIRWVWVIEAMIEPALLILTGILVIGRAKLGLWLIYLITAGFVYSLIVKFVHALRTREFDDIYSALFDACVLGVWFCIAAYFYNRREMFTGFWVSLEGNTNQSVDARHHAH